MRRSHAGLYIGTVLSGAFLFLIAGVAANPYVISGVLLAFPLFAAIVAFMSRLSPLAIATSLAFPAALFMWSMALASAPDLVLVFVAAPVVLFGIAWVAAFFGAFRRARVAAPNERT